MGNIIAKYKIGIVVPGLEYGGGVPATALFLFDIINSTEHYSADLISLATSRQDSDSICLLSPKSWISGISISTGTWKGRPYRKVGAFLAELEFQRYRPRRILTNLLNEYDLIQVVAGTPAWVQTVLPIDKPICLFAATAIKQERESIIEQANGLKKWYLSLMTAIGTRIEQRSLPQVDCVFPESQYTAQLLANLVLPEKLVLGLPGIDTTRFHPIPTPKEDYILAVGRFADPRKNSVLLFRAYHRLLQINPQAPKLRLAGHSMPSDTDWQVAKDLGIADKIELIQDISLDELIDLYQNASLFALSSNEEGLGIVIQEAMACGLPVVSTDCGGPRTIIEAGITGFLVPVGDVEGLAQSMNRILINPELRQHMAHASRQRAETMFSLAAAGNVYLTQYNHLLGVS